MSTKTANADMIIGAPLEVSSDRIHSGSAYVVYGGANLGSGCLGFRIDGAPARRWGTRWRAPGT